MMYEDLDLEEGIPGGLSVGVCGLGVGVVGKWTELVNCRWVERHKFHVQKLEVMRVWLVG